MVQFLVWCTILNLLWLEVWFILMLWLLLLLDLFSQMALEGEWRALSCTWEPFLLISLSCSAQSQSLPFPWAERISQSRFETENILLVAVLHVLEGVMWQQQRCFSDFIPHYCAVMNMPQCSLPPYKREVKQKSLMDQWWIYLSIHTYMHTYIYHSIVTMSGGTHLLCNKTSCTIRFFLSI